MSSVFSRKITMSTFSGRFTGEGTPLKYWTGRRQTKRSRSCRNATLSERMPPPTGVVSGPLIEIRKSRTASTVSSGNHCLNALNAFSPANTSNHATRRFPPYAFSTAASNTRRDAFQISLPVPSPSINGIIGLSGTFNTPPSYPIAFPSPGTATPLYAFFITVPRSPPSLALGAQPFLAVFLGFPSNATTLRLFSAHSASLRYDFLSFPTPATNAPHRTQNNITPPPSPRNSPTPQKSCPNPRSWVINHHS